MQSQERETEVSDREPTESAQRVAESLGDSYQKILTNAVAAQERNVNLAQGWAEGINETLATQAETNRALTKAMESYVTVVDEALKSQEKTNRALTESLESYREVVERANASQEQSVKLAQGFFESLESEVRSQAENNQALLQGLAEQSGKQWEMMEAMVRESMEASMRMFNLPFPYGGPAGSRKDPE